MEKQKIRLKKRAAFIMLPGLVLFLLLAGCKTDEEMPFYRFEEGETPVLIVDGIRYIEDTDIIRQQTSAMGLFWKFSGEIGDTIGVCDDSAEYSNNYKVSRIRGDEEQNFLYISPNHFAFGPYYTYFCAREDLQMELPSAETVSFVTFICNDAENTSLRVDDSAAIASLLDVFNGDDIQVPNGEDWLNGVLVMQNREFPFLQCEIQFCYSPRQGISCCQNTEREWFLLPEQWSAIISELDFSV